MDVEQRARTVFGLSWADYWMERGQPDVAHDFDAFSRAEAWALQHFHSAITPPEGHVVVTRNEAGQAVAVTRQDYECRILSVIAELEPPEGYVLVEASIFDAMREFVTGFHCMSRNNAENLAAEILDDLNAKRPEVKS